MTPRTSCHIQKHFKNHSEPAGPRTGFMLRGETMHHFATSCGFVPTGPACLGRPVSATGEHRQHRHQHRLRGVQDHPRPCETGGKRSATDSHALNGYPCLNLCVHTSPTCGNTSEWLEVGEEGLETCAGLPDRASA